MAIALFSKTSLVNAPNIAELDQSKDELLSYLHSGIIKTTKDYPNETACYEFKTGFETLNSAQHRHYAVYFF